MAADVSERQYVRDLAKRVAEIAGSERNRQRRRRWEDVSARRKPDRFPVWCRPVGAWDEILPKSSLRCADEWLRNVEYRFRQMLIKDEIGDDSVVEPFFALGAVLEVDPPNVWGVEIGRHAATAAGGAWAYDPPIKEWADLERLRLPKYTHNEQATRDAMGRAEELLGEILPPRLVCNPPIGATLCSPATDLRGMTPLMMDLIESPEQVHRLMAYLRDAALGAIEQVEAAGLAMPQPSWPMEISEPPSGRAGDPTSFAGAWVHGNSQEFDQVSPAMWEEFLLAYQKPIFERFGAVSYGCCENLTNKIDRVLTIPNLRIFTCSAWTDLDAVIEKVGTKHVIMWRQKATDVVFPDSAETLRADLGAGLKKLQGHHVQIVLRELQTLAGHPDRLHVWTRLAIEAAEKYA